MRGMYTQLTLYSRLLSFCFFPPLLFESPLYSRLENRNVSYYVDSNVFNIFKNNLLCSFYSSYLASCVVASAFYYKGRKFLVLV